MNRRAISHYELLDQIGEGSMGVVYRTGDTRLERLLVLKLLPPRLAGGLLMRLARSRL